MLPRSRFAIGGEALATCLKQVYAQAEREQRPEYSPLPKWETLSIEVHEAIIHVYHQGRLDALREKKS